MDPGELSRAIDALADEYRTRCLWFLRAEYYPRSKEEQLQVLTYIARYADADGFKRAKALQSWLSRPFNAASSAS